MKTRVLSGSKDALRQRWQQNRQPTPLDAPMDEGLTDYSDSLCEGGRRTGRRYRPPHSSCKPILRATSATSQPGTMASLAPTVTSTKRIFATTPQTFNGRAASSFTEQVPMSE